MPTPVTPNRPSKAGGTTRSTKPLDIGQPLGVHDTNTVRARVRQWQQQGGGVITIDDGVYDDDDEENKPKKTPKPKPKIENVKADKVEKPKEKDTEKEKEKKIPQTRKRSHSTPRKRVISDEHWRRNRSNTQTSTRNLPVPKRINEYTTNEGTGTPRAKRENDKDELERPKRGTRRDTVASKSPTPEAKHPSPRKADIESVADSDLETDLPRSTTLSDIPEASKRESPPPDDVEWAKSEADFTELSRGIFAQIVDESRKMFKLPEPEPPRPTPVPPGQRGAKIEAWLSDTPDPFLDNESKDDMPGPLDIRSARARRSRRLADDESTILSPSELSLESESRPKSSHSRHSRDKDSISEKRKSLDRDSTSEVRLSSIGKAPRPLPLRIREEKLRDKPYEESTLSLDSDLQTASEGSEVSGNNAPVPLGRKKAFPSTGGHRLSTIASAETLSTLIEDSSVSQKTCQEKTLEEAEEAAEEKDNFDPNSLPVVSSQLKRRLTTHNDLMSVLSVPTGRSRSIRSARSIRTNKSRLASATVPDIMAELSADEAKYMRELKTLVGGVIPVLLTCVLSRSDAAIAAGLFRPSMDPKDDMNFSKPIVNMGVAIERLKTLHKRIPQDNPDALLTWAQGAQRVYREYLKAWRLGFKDVIVNLAPLEEGEEDNGDTKSLDEGMERDENGDVVDADGEKVDVAYLLKRPLVRLKYLAKSFKGINILQPSPKAEEIANAYQALVVDARKRTRDERARLEDESAASVDPTRARDPMTLGILQNVSVDQTRHVRARDFFNLSLYHSSGQLVDCRAELLYRDNASNDGPGGDLLISRTGETKGEIVMMLRSAPGEEKYWQELLSLRIDEVEIGAEWVQLLGSEPVPPAIFRTQSFISRAKQHKARKSPVNDSPPRTNPSDVDIPIGEKAASKRRSLTPKEQYSEPSTVSSATDNRSSLISTATRETDYTTGDSELSNKQARSGPRRRGTPATVTMGESLASGDASAQIALSERAFEPMPATDSPTPGRFYGGDVKNAIKSADSIREKSPPKSPPKTPRTPRREPPEPESPRVSSVPSAYLPQIPKIRSTSSQTHLSAPSSGGTEEEDEDYPPLDSLPEQPQPETPTRSRRRKSRRKSKHDDAPPPPPPPHRSPSSKLPSVPVLSPAGVKLKRRGSSPLKHEYEPSTASDSYSDTDSDASTVRHYSYSSSDYSRDDDSDSDYSSESEPEEKDLPQPKIRGPASTETSSLSPSNSASQSGYRTVPLQPGKSTKVIASIFAWSSKGNWETLLPDECSIAVSPGLIEAFKMNADPHSTSPSRSSRPLISMELTPLVPIRRGTAIDISIRSPPTERSQITTSNNIMFRSRNPDDCDALYALINHARINNPTYIALQNARGPFNDHEIPNYDPAPKSGGSWFGFPRRRKSYRASSSPRSLAEGSESSVGTMSSAFSALKRFGGGSKMFNISRSTIESRSGREGSMYSGDGDADSASPSGGIGRIAAAIKGADGIGLSNAKIRVYLRESASKWRDMGAARLTIMPAPPKNLLSRPGTAFSGRSDGSGTHDGASSPPSSGAATPRTTEPEKRIIIRGKTRSEVLLDVCLPESSFERVARTGIAVSVYEEIEGGTIAKQGGVSLNSQRIYMLQMKSEAETAYTFGLVGKLRY
ncbi:uncharacterized protein N7477_002248 [Penicillium maclennaniae]|uniref:uncharacterized protein n=1 Tax=Penicillium maclennaniae TaxID=1343394 RepID=UPI002540F6BD|nr:uncharacterized protein N7477_002248 [Penicillium maclennaniae]KAJ5676615.1 hypothetical protein N7477_002248 [Penicillium maclennaniae]